MLTTVIKVLAHFHVTVAPCCNVEVSLDFVALHAAINSAAVRKRMFRQPGGLRPFLARPGRSEIVVHILLPVFTETWVSAQVQSLIFRLGQVMELTISSPLNPRGRILVQLRASQNPVSTGVLNIYVQVLAAHVHHDIQIDLQVMPDSLLHAECMCCLSGPPSSKLCRSQPYARKHEHYCPDAARVALFGV